jgi:hypothetical protein
MYGGGVHALVVAPDKTRPLLASDKILAKITPLSRAL